jgi:hypothetical protein
VQQAARHSVRNSCICRFAGLPRYEIVGGRTVLSSGSPWQSGQRFMDFCFPELVYSVAVFGYGCPTCFNPVLVRDKLLEVSEQGFRHFVRNGNAVNIVKFDSYGFFLLRPAYTIRNSCSIS